MMVQRSIKTRFPHAAENHIEMRRKQFEEIKRNGIKPNAKKRGRQPGESLSAWKKRLHETLQNAGRKAAH